MKSTSAPKNSQPGKAGVKNSEGIEIFSRVNAVLVDVVPRISISRNSDTNYELISAKAIFYRDVCKNAMYFAALAMQKPYVALRLMHIFTHQWKN